MRKALAAAAGVALLVALYAAAGYWLAPRFLRDALADQAARRGITLELATLRTNPFALRVALEGITLRGPKGQSFAGAQSASADLTWASLWRRIWIVEAARVEQPWLAAAMLPATGAGQGGESGDLPPVLVRRLGVHGGAVRFPETQTSVEALELELHDVSTLSGQNGRYELAARVAGGRINSHGGVSLSPDGLALHEVSVEASDVAHRGIRLARLALEAPKVVLPPRQPFEISAQASVLPRGELSAKGSVGVEPLQADLKVEFDALPLPEAQRFLPETIALRIASGALSGKGDLHIGEETAAYEGTAVVRDLRVEERASSALLLAWQRADAEALRLTFSPFSVETGELHVRAPEARLAIAQDGSVNFATVFHGGNGGGKPLHASLERLRIEQGTLHFADRALDKPFEVTIRKLSGGVTGFSTAAGEPARVRLTGRVPPYGSARIRGTIDLNSPTSLAEITANFRNLRLEAFNPYIAKFAGYRIESGRLSAQLRYEVREGRLVGTNDLAFEHMQLGEKLETKGLLDLPLELAVALLADAQGRIDLDIPVRGNLKDPQFDIGAIVARAFGNVLRKIVSAPFRALAALFGGKDRDPGAVPFDPGSATLSPPAEEDVAQLAKALEERPRLGVAVHGGYDPARDLEALRLRTARQEVAREAGVKGPLDFGNPKVVHAAERLYLKRVGSRAQLQALRKTEERYGRALLQKLAAAVPADAAEAQALARSRAEAVRAALIDHGVDPARVRVAEPAQEKAGEEDVPTTLSLTADVPATARASPGPSSRETVRRVQRSLKAEGLDPGPVDGILGPRTRRAIIKFQAAQGLELTGELDARTLSLILSAA